MSISRTLATRYGITRYTASATVLSYRAASAKGRSSKTAEEVRVRYTEVHASGGRQDHRKIGLSTVLHFGTPYLFPSKLLCEVSLECWPGLLVSSGFFNAVLLLS